jgi:hypothetical protein
MKLLAVFILLFSIGLWGNKALGQTIARSGIRLARITYLASNFDSLTRSFLKKGYRIKTGKREPGGVFNNSILFPNGCEIIIEATTSNDSNNWRMQALKKYGNHIAGIAFEVDGIDSLYHALQFHNIPVGSFGSVQIEKIDGSKYTAHAFALDSCVPLDVVFYSKDSSSLLHSPETDSLTRHPNHHFRFDWVLLSANPAIESRVRKIFEVINAWKQHEGCCDFWRVGPSDDFCFFRFDPPPPKAKGKPNWLSIEPDGIYFAY